MRRIHYDFIDSTNAQARKLWEQAASAQYVHAVWTPDSVLPSLALSPDGGGTPLEPLLVTAVEQSAGRGRRGRIWCSPRGGAWMSLIWPMRRLAADYAAVSLAAAVGVRRGMAEVIEGVMRNAKFRMWNGEPTIDSRQPTDVLIKWPNDLLIEGKKVGGILCEQFVGARGEAGSRAPLNEGVLIVGVGVNVDFDLALLGPADGLRHPATTLSAALGRRVEVESVIETVSRQLAEALGQFERNGISGTLLEELRQNLAYVGTVRRWSSHHGEVAGRVRGVDQAGRLMLETELGMVACEVGEILE
jgi:BirA family biotin operon repressor/biotin-[acetyl-CoA-carboxylase] ligase